MDDMEHAGSGSGSTREDYHWNNQKGQCGIQGNHVKCPKDKPCCDKHGMCSLSEEGCGHGCQRSFGACLASRNPETTGNTSGGNAGAGSGNANSLQADDTQATTITPITAAIVGASAFVAGLLFAVLLFVAAKKREERAAGSDEEKRKDVVEVAAEEEDNLDNNNNDDGGNRSVARISSLHSTPTFGTLGNDGYPNGGGNENDGGDYVLSPNSTMFDAEEDNDIQLNMDEGGWPAAVGRASGRTDAFGQDANLATLEQHLYNAESRQHAKSHMSSIREEVHSDHDAPFDEPLPLEQQPPPPAFKRDMYFDYNDDNDFLAQY